MMSRYKTRNTIRKATRNLGLTWTYTRRCPPLNVFAFKYTVKYAVESRHGLARTHKKWYDNMVSRSVKLPKYGRLKLFHVSLLGSNPNKFIVMKENYYELTSYRRDKFRRFKRKVYEMTNDVEDFVEA